MLLPFFIAPVLLAPGALAASSLASEAPLVDAAIRAHVAAAVGVAEHDVEVRHNGLGVAFPCGPTASLTVMAAPNETYRRHVHLRLQGDERGGRCADLRVRAEVVVWQQVPVARDATGSGQVVHTTLARVERHTLIGPVVAEDHGTMVAISPIAAGTPVMLSRVRLRPDQRSGAQVTLVAGRPGVTIRATGRLLHDAQVGDRVRVANAATGSVVVGILGEDGQVKAQGAE